MCEKKSKAGTYLDPVVHVLLKQVYRDPTIGPAGRVDEPVFQYYSPVFRCLIINMSELRLKGYLPELFGPNMSQVVDQVKELMCILCPACSSKINGINLEEKCHTARISTLDGVSKFAHEQSIA